MNTLKIIIVGFLAGVAGAYSFFTYQINEGQLSKLLIHLKMEVWSMWILVPLQKKPFQVLFISTASPKVGPPILTGICCSMVDRKHK